jgi:hypothetical protein
VSGSSSGEMPRPVVGLLIASFATVSERNQPGPIDCERIPLILLIVEIDQHGQLDGAHDHIDD